MIILKLITMKTIHLLSAVALLAGCATGKIKTADNIQKVALSTTPCFGTCPVFDMKIEANGHAEYEAKRFNPVTGKFTAVIRKEQMDSLFVLIDKAKLLTLPDEYTQQVTDMPTYRFSVQYKDGKNKWISDYGPMGPEALQHVYKFIFSLRESQTWKKQ